jgi:hypothetical protein
MYFYMHPFFTPNPIYYASQFKIDVGLFNISFVYILLPFL